ncbi:MAG: hypothetical protein J6X83_03920 [Methanomicrobium sp.]|nr:hypothetical protein [Methanomicrobium sp.]
MKKTALILGVLLIALVLACGCTTTSTSSSTVSVTGPTVIAIDGTFKVLEADESKNPTPFEVDLIAENRGNYDADNVKAEIIIIYDGEQILTDMAEFGYIRKGKSNNLQKSYDLTHPAAFDFDKLKMKVGKIYANGELLVDTE